MGALASELLAHALAADGPGRALPPLEWPKQDLRPRIDLEDKEAVWRVLDDR